MKRPNAFTTLLSLAVLILVGSWLGGLVFSLDAGIFEENRLSQMIDNRLTLEKSAADILTIMAQSFDPGKETWPAFLDSLAVRDSVQIKGRDLSGLVNLNTVHELLILNTEMREFFKKVSPADFVQKRFSEGPFSGFHKLTEYFEDSKAENYFTTWGYLNPNTTDDFMLEKIAGLKASSPQAGSSIRAKAQQYRTSKRQVKAEELNLFLSPYGTELLPIFRITADLNVNTADPVLIFSFLRYPGFGIENPNTKASNVIAERQSSYIDDSRLAALLGVEKSHSILQYLGTKSYYFELTLESAHGGLRLVIVNDSLESEKEKSLRVLEKVWLP